MLLSDPYEFFPHCADARAGGSETLLTLLGYSIAYLYLLLYDVAISNKASLLWGRSKRAYRR